MNWVRDHARGIVYSIVVIGLLDALLWYHGWYLGWPYSMFGRESHHAGFGSHDLAVFLELALAVGLIELLWKGHEKTHEERERRRQLQFIKAYMFQGHMYNLFKANFDALQASQITFLEIRTRGEEGSLDKLKALLEGVNGKFSAETIRYRDHASKARVLLEYANAETDVWKRFVELAVLFNFPDVVKDMAQIQSCIARVKRKLGSRNFEDGVAEFFAKSNKSKEDQRLDTDIHEILAAGIYKFILYAKELAEDKGGNKEGFRSLMALYCDSSGTQDAALSQQE